MKELSIEEKAKAYDKAIEMAKLCLKDGTITNTSISYIETIFPELVESEDEMIRKMIINTLNRDKILTEDEAYDCVTWLEKQGEQELQGKTALEAINEEKVDNQNCVKTTDKVEPKFKVGDWIIRSAEGYKHNTYLVTEVKDYYVCEELKGRRVTFTFNDVHKNFKLWDVSDAKDGDVLAAYECLVLFKEIDGLNIRCYCTYHYMNHQAFYVDTLQNKTAFYPATKEQHELLFSKMKEADYVWNDEKKELKVIEQELTELAKGEDYGIDGLYAAVDILQKTLGKVDGYQTDDGILEHECAISAVKELYEQKHTWSEEDEYMRENLIRIFEINYPNEYYKAVRKDLSQELIPVVYSSDIICWLKSLKERIGGK